MTSGMDGRGPGLGTLLSTASQLHALKPQTRQPGSVMVGGVCLGCSWYFGAQLIFHLGSA